MKSTHAYGGKHDKRVDGPTSRVSGDAAYEPMRKLGPNANVKATRLPGGGCPKGTKSKGGKSYGMSFG